MNKMITLKSSDNETFVIEEAVANGSQTIKHMIEDDCAESAIPLPNVDSKILAKVIEYLKTHASATTTETETADDDNKKAETEALKAFDKEFVKVDQSTLFDLTVAANYLDIKGLLDLTCQTIADLIKEKTPKEIRQIFNVNNDFTPEEEEEVQRKNTWAFE